MPQNKGGKPTTFEDIGSSRDRYRTLHPVNTVSVWSEYDCTGNRICRMSVADINLYLLCLTHSIGWIVLLSVPTINWGSGRRKASFRKADGYSAALCFMPIAVKDERKAGSGECAFFYARILTYTGYVAISVISTSSFHWLWHAFASVLSLRLLCRHPHCGFGHIS